ncbi:MULTISPECIES: restriction endonuclease [Micromonospora]|nr:restriction endonuclease [Micromonospora yangpuensis]
MVPWLGAAGLVVLLLLAVLNFVQRHPYWSIFLLLLIVAGAVAVLRARAGRRAQRRAEQLERDRAIGVTDGMTGSEFEHWFARLMEASGFRDVQVRGGAGDRGADVVAKTPDGRRVVVQCKRQSLHNRVGSAAIQRFAGTCRDIHGGQLCMIVTNGFFTAGDGVRLAQQLDILLIDRRALEAWAWTRVPPTGLLVAG